jgi:hypothetical protein
MTGGFDPRDADPLMHVDDGPSQAHEPAGRFADGLWLGCFVLIAAIAAGVVLGAVITLLLTAPRAAQSATGDATGSVRAEQLGAPSTEAPPSLSAARSATSEAGGAPTPPPAADLKQSPAITPKPTERPVTEPPAIEGGIASWCAPTPTQCRRWGGTALLGAVHSFRWGDRPYRVRVCRQVGAAACVVVTVVSYCGCPDGRAIDLSPYAFGKLAPLSRGLVPVTVEELR